MSNQDLPLLANINDIRARHYLIRLEPNFTTKVIRGKVFIFFEPTSECEVRGGCCTRECTCGSENGTNDQTRILYKYTPRPLPRTECHMSDDDSDDDDDSYPQNNGETNAANDDGDGVDKDFETVLDCCDIRVKSVSEVNCEGIDLKQYLDPNHQRLCKFTFNCWSAKESIPLQYSVNPWCIKIWKPGVKEAKGFPSVVCIDYETTPQGKSLLWRTDQDGNPCLFTPAAAINNRSLVPCQDPPFAMATWQAWVTVRKEFVVSMTGDTRPVKFVGHVENQEYDDATHKVTTSDCCTGDDNNSDDEEYYGSHVPEWEISRVSYYYHTTMVLPIATIAIAAGMWETQTLPTLRTNAESTDHPCHHYQYPCHHDKEKWSRETPLTVIHPISCTQAVKPLVAFLPYALRGATGILGTYPCRRLEVVVLPQCFGSLGLASPNLIFLSPTVVIDDPSAFIRLAHEISHAWFGIVLGAQDWTEEWLSEGFATYLEDSIFADAALAYHHASRAPSNADQPPVKRSRNGTSEEGEKKEGEEEKKGDGKEVGMKQESQRDDAKDGKGNKEEKEEKDKKDEDDGEKKGEVSKQKGKEEEAVPDEQKTSESQEEDHSGSNEHDSEDEEDGKVVYSELGRPTEPLRLCSGKALTRGRLDELADLRAHIRYRTLASELEHSAEELQTLRPMQGESLMGADGVSYVKNGLNPDKAFLQVHYLKGYFLLKYMSNLVGRAKFDAMIREYAGVYHGQLVLSRHILDYFVKTFPQMGRRGATQEALQAVWLNQPGLNEEMTDMYAETSNDLVAQVNHHLQFWEHFDKSKKRSGQTIKRAKVQLDPFVFPDQLVLLLEYLLELPKVYKRTLRQINEYYQMSAQCGDARHRWCELVIKNDYEDLSQVERFLREDQAMGVYLYGELIISRNTKHTRLADQMFTKIQEDMDETSRMAVFSMLYGE